jgi:glycerol-3-phosphate dehydrogenase
MSDESIRGEVEKALSKKGFGNITVEVREGVAYLSGELKDWDDIVHAGLAVGKLKCVREVVNEIKYPGMVEEKEQKFEPVPYAIPKEIPDKCDVLIVGGGVTGCAIARELSRYNLDIVLVEKESDVACGASRANNGMVHPGISTPYHSLKRVLNVKGNAMYDQVCKALEVPFDRCGMYVVVTDDTFAPKIKNKIPKFLHKLAYNTIVPSVAINKAKKYGIPASKISREQLLGEEPNLAKNAICAISFPTTAMTCPYKLTIAYAENAAMNGAKFLLNTKVTGIKAENGEVKTVETNRGSIQAKCIINAAGVYADKIAKMAGACDFTIHPRKGSMLIFDSAEKGHINHILAQLNVPTDKYTKGGGASVSVDGNVLLGPTAIEQESRENVTVTREESSRIFSKYCQLLPNIPQRSVITFFAGVRAPTYKEDFVIGATKVKGFVNVAGIQSPGLASAPAIAEMVVGIVKDSKLFEMQTKADFNPIRKDGHEFRKLSHEEQQKVIEKNPHYGNVICRCETITEGEIIDAIHRPVPALTMDAIKRRTRAGMGRCQSGFCGPRVAEILARELNVPITSITKDGAGSEVFFGKTK